MAKKKNFQDIIQEKDSFSTKLNLDSRDQTIITLIQQNPKISQEEIAKKIKLSQPSVGARIRKLQQKGVLSHTNGVNFRLINLHLAKVDLSCIGTKSIIQEFNNCPFFINALITSGRYNLCLLFAATNLERLEEIVDYHLRSNPNVKDVEMNLIISTYKDLILPLNPFCQDNLCQEKCEQL